MSELKSNDEPLETDEAQEPLVDRPLSWIVGPEYQDVDPTLYFPSFKPGEVLRVSTLFGVHPKTLRQNMIWWPSRTFFKKVPPQPEADKKKNHLPRRIDCAQDQMDFLLASEAELEALRNPQTEEDEEPPPWRFGPAQIWYDRMGLTENPKRFDYGFRVTKPNKIPLIAKKAVVTKELSEEDLLPVNLLPWEDDVIYDDTQIKPQFIEALNKNQEPKCGWTSTQQTRTYESYRAAFAPDNHIRGPSTNHSIFPVGNYDLESTRWEDDVIYDPDDMPAIPQPKILTVEYDEDPRIFGMPEDIPGDDRNRDDGSKQADRKEHTFTKKSKMILGQVQRRQKQEEEEQLESTVADKDPFNLSNDDYYYPKNVQRSIGSGAAIQHSIPAQNIHRAFFPTQMNAHRLRHFHRMAPTKRLMRDYIAHEVPVKNVVHQMEEVEEKRRQQKMVEGGGEIFHMRSLRDLTSKDGKMLLIEYSEEHPPFMSQPGMSSKIRNYYKRKTQNEPEPSCEFGETAFTSSSPFLGNLEPGQCLQALENNMFRAPIYRHATPETDFILIRSADGFYLRECPILFVAGQECPLLEVPSPNSKRASVFVRDFLLAFIYRLFWESDHQPRRIRMEDIKEAFPQYAESSIRKRLKQCSDFKRLGAGPEQNYWVIVETQHSFNQKLKVIRADFRLPSKEEVLSMVTPEMCCAQYSMQVSEQRLKDAGYGEKYFFTPENDDDSDDQITMEDEIKCAPWNTTRAYIAAMKGKCLLDQTGVADPTGCGQGFSYVRVSAKPAQKEEVPQMPKRLVTGTNADLRKLPLKEAKEICRSYGVREEEIKLLSRWEIIDVIRTLSTQAAKSRSDFSGMARFARGNIRFNFDDMREKYKQYCQGVFLLQNRNLSCTDELSTDEGSDNADSDNEEMASNLEKMLDSGKNAQKMGRGKVSFAANKKAVEAEDEEEERRALQRMIHGETAKSKDSKSAAGTSKNEVTQTSQSTTSGVVKKLRIYRTIKAADGSQSTRVEIINNQQVIDAYTKIRESKEPEFIKVYAQMDEEYKEEKRKEKRRLQDQLRRIKRNEQKQKLPGAATIGRPPKKKNAVPKKPAPIKESLLKMKCSACGGTGHMKTNKNCPLYGKDPKKKGEKTVADVCKSKETNIPIEEMNMANGELLTCEGTKFKISKKFITFVEEQKKKELKLRIPHEFINQRKTINQLEDEKGPHSSGHSRYDTEIEEFACSSYAAEMASPASTIGSSSARHSRTGANWRKRPAVDDTDYLFGPTKHVQRRRADPRVSMSSILLDIFNELKSVNGVDPLMKPVNSKVVPDYYKIIKNPMDLQQVRNRINEYQYELRSQFLADLSLIVNNSEVYNGVTHPITVAAKTTCEIALRMIKEHESRLIDIEKAINPLLHENDLVGFSYILTDIVQRCKNVPKSAAFHVKVDGRKLPEYYTRISNPMDLGTIEQKAKNKDYQSIESFMSDIRLIYDNSLTYNGPESLYTQKAKEIVECAKKLIEEKTELQELQSRICAPVDGQGGEFVDVDETTRDTFTQADDQESRTDVDQVEHESQIDYDESTQDLWESTADGLATSQMHAFGQLNADLALSDSDSDDNTPSKRPRLNPEELEYDAL
ncbi:Transcription initiation factor TFIID subunit 1 [Aphelenchoides besseyi]|nr:Transcription initiation factor TFIID subunit 1 [Aphelenchoides besseyi]